MNMEEKDRDIIASMRRPAEREAGFTLLINTYQEKLYGHLRRMLKSHQDADDALQNSLIKIWKNFDSFRGDSALYTWLYRIATNEALTILEKQRHAHLHVDASEVALSGMCDGPDSDEIAQRLWAALDTLPPKQRQVFDLKYFEEMKYDEIAAITHTSVGALKASYFHAVKKVEAFLTHT